MERSTTEHPRLSVEDYLRLEDAAEVRHEYVGGTLHALAGASKRHNLIAGNVFHALRSRGVGHPGCRVYMSDVKLRVADEVIYYPDVMVVCGPEGNDPMVEDAPCLVVEVTSPSTAAIDRREKLFLYRRIPTLGAYLIVDQAARRVDRHWRGESGAWPHEVIEGEGGVPVPCPGGELTLGAIYERSGVTA